MNKFIFVDIKKLKKRYRSIVFAVSVPFFQFIIAIFIVFWFASNKNTNNNMKQYTVFMAIVSLSLLISIIVVGTLISRHFLKVHKKNTFIDISSRILVVSRHSQTYLNKFKQKYQKRLYVIKLSELQSISTAKGKLIVKGKIRFLHEKADWLLYSFNDNGISFEKWWYDNNAGVMMDTLEVPDVFINTNRAVRLVKRLSSLDKERIKRQQKYHDEMLERAKNTPIQRPRKKKFTQSNNYKR